MVTEVSVHALWTPHIVALRYDPQVCLPLSSPSLGPWGVHGCTEGAQHALAPQIIVCLTLGRACFPKLKLFAQLRFGMCCQVGVRR